MNWYLKVLRQYADFNGRARRTEFWMFVLFNIIFSLVANTLDYMFGFYGVISVIYGLAMLIPGLAVSVRRLHDVNKSGWMILVALIPVIGFIWLLVLYVTEGTPGENQYGANPKEVEVVAA
jgi:uncharacterized membrane protein YhaH (DUF805 family)